MLEEFKIDAIKLFDLHLQASNSAFQIDCLLIFQNECVLIEVKNYQGGFYLKDDGMYLLKNHEKIKNPFSQLERSETLLKRWFNEENISLKIRPLIVFTHPEFFLYEAPINLPAIFPAQLKRFSESLTKKSCRLNKNHYKLAELLESKHIGSSSYETKIEYDYKDLNKGIICEKCDGMVNAVGRKGTSCNVCGYTESLEDSVMRNVREFSTLFPDKKITVSAIAHWTGEVLSKHNIRIILSKHCLSRGTFKDRRYLFKEK